MEIKAWDDARIENIFYQQKNVSVKKADISVIGEIIADKNIEDARMMISDKTGKKVLATKKVNLAKGLNKIEIPISISNPKLWWSNGLGEPHLYDFKAEIIVDSKNYGSVMLKRFP
ncbi:MAG TPA: hypothetical protein PK110_13170, partial [Niabella sp.]|nr:hypothetical protein [Niabella sp.]